MIRNIFFITSFLIFSVYASFADERISAQDLEQSVKYLASDELKGRFPGTEGSDKAAKFIADKFSEYGLKPYKGSFFHEFDMISDISLGTNNLLKINKVDAKLETDFIPLSFSKNGAFGVSGFVACGYGLIINNDSLKWNDFKNVNLSGKWAMLFAGNPEMDKEDNKFAGYDNIRTKVLNAKDHGALGVLVIIPSIAGSEDILFPLNFDKVAVDAGIPVINVSRGYFDQVINSQGKSITDLEKHFSVNNASPVTFDMPINVISNLKLHNIKAKNVIAVLEAPKSKNPDRLCTVIGAHYDHIGMGGEGSSSRMKDTLAVHNGADDNASGVAAVLEIAEYFAAMKDNLKQNFIFCAFDAEEFGTLGSKSIVAEKFIPADKISLMINIDMLGRLKPEARKLLVGGTGTFKNAENILNEMNESMLNLVFSKDGYGPSDHSSFYIEDIPVLFFSTAAHEDYHTPFDDYDKLNYEGLAECSEFIASVMLNVSSDSKPVFQRSGYKPALTFGSKYKVKLGFMPDFASAEAEGLGIASVSEGSPAQLAGIKKGDRIIAINGSPITNIYDYTARLKQLEPGETITVDLIRDGEKIVLLVQL